MTDNRLSISQPSAKGNSDGVLCVGFGVSVSDDLQHELWLNAGLDRVEVYLAGAKDAPSRFLVAEAVNRGCRVSLARHELFGKAGRPDDRAIEVRLVALAVNGAALAESVTTLNPSELLNAGKSETAPADPRLLKS